MGKVLDASDDSIFTGSPAGFLSVDMIQTLQIHTGHDKEQINEIQSI